MPIICDANNIVVPHITQFIESYQEARAGLASQFIYLPNLWAFIRSEIDNEEQSADYRERLKK